MKSPSTMSSGLWIAVVTAIAIDLTMARIIDLTHDHNIETIMNGGSPKYTSTLLFKGDYIPGVFVELQSYSVGEHGGTHIDAPNHFIEGGRSLSEIPIEDTILEGVMVDCAEEAANDMMFKVTVKKLTDWEKVYGRITDGAGVIFNFNRSSRFTDPKSYYETDNLNDTRLVPKMKILDPLNKMECQTEIQMLVLKYVRRALAPQPPSRAGEHYGNSYRGGQYEGYTQSQSRSDGDPYYSGSSNQYQTYSQQ